MHFIFLNLFRTTNYKEKADHYTESNEYICLCIKLYQSHSFYKFNPPINVFTIMLLKVTIPLFQIILHVILKINFKYQILGF